MKNSRDNIIDFTLSEVSSNKPGIYVIYDNKGKVVYVGSSTNLHNRIIQHTIRQDSSVTMGASATSLNPEKISAIHWWLHDSFKNKNRLKAAELIAFKKFNPKIMTILNNNVSSVY